MNKKFVSIVIPCYGEYIKYLDRCLDCVEKQTYRDFEVIIETYPDIVKARNIAIREKAKGDYILCLDVDDIIYPQYLEKVMKEVDENTIVAVGWRTNFNSSIIPSIGDFIFQNHIIIESIFSKKIFNTLGGFDEEMQGYQDWDFWARAYWLGFRFKVIPEVLVEVEIRSDGHNQLYGVRYHNELRQRIVNKIENIRREKQI